MSKIDTKAVCRAYLEMCLADWHKADLAMKALDAIVSGGEKQKRLERLFDDTDSARILRGASFRLAGDDDPLKQIINRISD